MSRINNELLENVLVEGTRKFSKPKRADRNVYGKIHGANRLLAYYRYINPRFDTPRHIKLIAEKLTAVAAGKTKRLIINMPPQHGKTEICSKCFPTWVMGRRPDSHIIVSSYSTERAEYLTRWQRDTCTLPEYRVIFPEVLVGKAELQKKDQWETSAGGLVIGAGIQGAITGFGASLGIIDDPVKDYQTAISELVSDAIWDWYRSTFYSRLTEDAPIVVIMTRWMSNDLTGRLINEQGLIEDGGEWDRLKLPALDLEGNALWPERYSAEYLMETRKNIGEKMFSSLYQQDPIDIIERLFADPKFEEPPRDLKKIGYLDPSFGGSDYSALAIGGIHRKDEGEGVIYITAGEIWKGQIDVTYDKTEKICKSLNIGTLYVEANQAQKALAHEFRKRGIIVREVQNMTNKHLRIMNDVKVPWSRIRFSRAVSDAFLKQVLNYSELARHDDAPDSLAGLIKQLGQGGPSIERRYDFIKSLWR
ncbi:MAG: terminase family protein [Spirochaetes bacterium]|nr:terminase family protein [Spirochaetota bacterium]